MSQTGCRNDRDRVGGRIGSRLVENGVDPATKGKSELEAVVRRGAARKHEADVGRDCTFA